jgi:hypothetical protein
MTVSFRSDIMPIFKQFQAEMAWRMDLTSYEDVRANYQAILSQITTGQMPPPPFPPLTNTQIGLFVAWMNEGFPE